MTKRFAALALGTALLAASLPAAPAHADGSHSCFFGDRAQDEDGYTLTAWSCTGTGYSAVTVTIVSGAAAGVYTCRTAFPWNGTLSGSGCHIS
ncbi:hypothetical protein [Streptosporangium sp. KLBMP 9127]|nr:hypothetical protein [Streptosporangium sp. KLBMP 9127]